MTLPKLTLQVGNNDDYDDHDDNDDNNRDIHNYKDKMIFKELNKVGIIIVTIFCSLWDIFNFCLILDIVLF